MSVVALTVPLELADGGQAYVGSVSGVGDLFIVNTTGYNSISVQLSGTWVGTVTFSISNDGIAWTPIATATSNGVTIYPTTGIYFKAAVTAYTSGTVNALAYLRFQQVSDITIDADLADIDANTAATAANTAEILQQMQEGNSVPIIASATANGTLFTTDTLGYQTISVQLTGDWQANCVFQVSNDNVTFTNVQGYTFNNYMNSINTAQDNGVYIFPVTGRYFQVVVSGYKSGTVGCTSYLRTQSLAGIGETMLTQAMDQSNNLPINVNYQNTGQKPAAASVPVTLSDENIKDAFITGRAFTQTASYFGYNMLLDAADSGKAPAAPIDCLQYRSIYFQMNSAGTAGGNNTVNANFLPEASNDLVNWVNVAAVRLDGASAVGGTETRSINPVNYSGFAIFGANLMMRYFRLRCNSFSNSTFIQFTTTLRMTAMTYQINTFTNIGQQGGSGIGGASTMKAAGTQGDNIPPLIVGGLDRSIFRQELMGAMGAGGINNNYLTNGPYARNAYYDLAGAAGVAGPQPFLAEDKTYPVNVRLERTTNAQDSVQDLLQQILVELKALNYYTREIPLALNSGHLTSMDDDPENFFDDKTIARLTRGH
jgi:hypothetical protein